MVPSDFFELSRLVTNIDFTKIFIELNSDKLYFLSAAVISTRWREKSRFKFSVFSSWFLYESWEGSAITMSLKLTTVTSVSTHHCSQKNINITAFTKSSNFEKVKFRLTCNVCLSHLNLWIKFPVLQTEKKWKIFIIRKQFSWVTIYDNFSNLFKKPMR